MTKKFKLDGEEYREFTPEEYAQAELDEKHFLAEEAKKEKESQEKQTKKAAAEAKLAALGLNADDLKALGLG